MVKDKKAIAQNRAKKIAKDKAKAAKRKKAAASSSASLFESRYRVTRSELRDAPFYRALCSASLVKTGLGYVIIARELASGLIASAILLVDMYCLGVKDAGLRVLTPGKFDAMIDDFNVIGPMDEVSPEYASKLLHDVIAYARSLGFEPHPDFKAASTITADIDFSSCNMSFTFGEKGKPLYVNGPNSSPERDRAIIAQLAAKLGPDGFHYILGIGAPED